MTCPAGKLGPIRCESTACVSTSNRIMGRRTRRPQSAFLAHTREKEEYEKYPNTKSINSIRINMDVSSADAKRKRTTTTSFPKYSEIRTRQNSQNAYLNFLDSCSNLDPEKTRIQLPSSNAFRSLQQKFINHYYQYR